MQGQKAVVVLIIAMILTAGVGFFANVKLVDSTRTEYSLVGNLDAFMSANSSPTPQSELFNSIYNITGWNGDINTTNTVLPPNRANQYVYQEESSDHVSFNLPYNFGMHAYTLSGSYSGQAGNFNTNWTSQFFKTSLSDSQNVYMYSGSILPHTQNPTPGTLYTKTPVTDDLEEYGSATGGYGQTTTFQTTGGTVITTNKTLSVTFNGTDYSSSGCFIADVEDVFNNTALWVVTKNGKLAYDDEYAPMIYSTESQATTKENEYRSLYPTDTWSHRRMTMNDFSDKVRLYINQGNVKYVGDYEVNYNWTHSESGSNRTVNGSLDITGRVNDNIAYLQYKPTTEHWYAYSSTSNVALWDSSTVAVYSLNGDNMGFQLQFQMDYVIPAVYFDPTRYMGIEGTATWSNYDLNNTMVNTEVTFLWKGTGDIQLNGTGPILKVINVGNTYTIQTSATEFVPIGTYKGLEITMRGQSDTVQIRGILNEQVNEDDIPNTQEYIPSSVVYNVQLYDGNTTDDTVPVIPEYIYRLKFTSSEGYAYIQSTYILTDPNSLLWTDIDIDFADYFDEYKDNMRVLFQGFVRYGDSITINGQNWDIADSGFTVTVTEIITPAQGNPGDPGYVPAVTKTYDVSFNMNGLAVDYYDGHCRLVQTNGRNSVDLGEITDYTIQMGGTWFFSSSLSTIAVIPSKATVWNPGWDMDMNTTLLLFAGSLIFLTAVMMMRFRDMMGWEDIVILICAIVVPLLLVAV